METLAQPSGPFTDPTQTTVTNGSLRKVTQTAITSYNGRTGQYDIIGYGPEVVTTSSAMSKKVVSERSGFRTSNYRARVRAGELIPSAPFARKVVTTTGVMFKHKRIDRNSRMQPTYTETQVGWTPAGSDMTLTGVEAEPTALQWAVLDQKASTELRAKLKDMRVNVAMILAERDKTAMMVAKAAKTIADAVIALRKGNLAGAAEKLGGHVGSRRRRSHSKAHSVDPNEAFSRAWLELSYGWKPLLMDVKGLAEALAQFQVRPIRGKVTARKVLKIQTAKVTGSPTSSFYQKDEVDTVVSIKYSCTYEIKEPGMPSIAALGLTNPALLAWELVPFSFVVDWLLPIGDWLNSLDATVGLTFADGAKSTKRNKTTRRTKVSNTTQGTPGSYSYSVFRSEYQTMLNEDSVVRQKLDAFPATHFPAFDNPFSIRHMATSLALLKTAFSR